MTQCGGGGSGSSGVKIMFVGVGVGVAVFPLSMGLLSGLHSFSKVKIRGARGLNTKYEVQVGVSAFRSK